MRIEGGKFKLKELQVKSNERIKQENEELERKKGSRRTEKDGLENSLIKAAKRLATLED